jgi:hypothetical protein
MVDVIQSIKKIINGRPVHVVLDMKVFSNTVVKSVIPENKDGIDVDKVDKLLQEIKDNIVSMDIVEYNPFIGTTGDARICREIIRGLIKNVFDVKEKKINIFNEDSQFLVFRPMEQEDVDADIGWYILRGMTTEQKNDLISLIPDDTIITLDIDDDIYLVTKTTMNEQNERSYYTAELVDDVALFPQEKALMGFELIS